MVIEFNLNKREGSVISARELFILLSGLKINKSAFNEVPKYKHIVFKPLQTNINLTIGWTFISNVPLQAHTHNAAPFAVFPPAILFAGVVS